jgi:hypothetical protein
MRVLASRIKVYADAFEQATGSAVHRVKAISESDN